MKFLVDQAVSTLVARELARKGHDAVHVRDIGLADSSDLIIMERAHRENRVIVSQDTDFGTLLVTSGSPKPSVILFRMRDGRPTSQVRSLLSNLHTLHQSLEDGAIVVMEDAKIRVRRIVGKLE